MVTVELDGQNFVGKKTPQFLATIAACFGAFALGTAVVWTAPALPEMEENQDFGELTIEDKSWIASLVTLGGLVSGPFAGLAMTRFGRRGALMGLAIPCIIAWLFIAFGDSVSWIYVGRFILGFCVGSYTVIVNVYIAEIAEDKIRGTLGFFFPICISAGVLYTYIMGALFTWRILTYANMLFPMGLLAGMYFVPESPVYLLGKGKKKNAGKALMWLRGADNFENIENELQQMQGFVEDSQSRRTTFKDFFAPAVLKPTLISVGLLTFQQMSGVNCILFYTVSIFKESGSDMDPSLASLIVGIVVLGSCLVSTPFIDRAGRRILLIISAAGMSLALGVMGLFFYLKELNENATPEQLGWLPLACLITFIFALNWGYGPVPWLMLGELIPSHVKGAASAVVTTVNWFLCFLLVKTFEEMARQVGVYSVYWLFSACSFLGIFFAYFIVPETRGKTLEEIEKLFSKPSSIGAKNGRNSTSKFPSWKSLRQANNKAAMLTTVENGNKLDIDVD